MHHCVGRLDSLRPNQTLLEVWIMYAIVLLRIDQNYSKPSSMYHSLVVHLILRARFKLFAFHNFVEDNHNSSNSTGSSLIFTWQLHKRFGVVTSQRSLSLFNVFPGTLRGVAAIGQRMAVN
jgi:hypothetical protein